MVSGVFVSLFVTYFCYASTQDEISIPSGIQVDNVTETFENWNNTNALASTSKFITTAEAAKKETNNTKTDEIASLNLTSAVPSLLGELSSAVKATISGMIERGFKNDKTGLVNLTTDPKRLTATVPMKEIIATTRSLLTLLKGAVKTEDILSTFKVTATEIMSDSARNVSGDDKVSSKSYTMGLEGLKSPSNVVTTRTDSEEKSSVTSKVASEDQTLARNGTVSHINNVTELLQSHVSMKIEDRQNQTEFKQLAISTSSRKTPKTELLTSNASQKEVTHPKEITETESRITAITFSRTSLHSGTEFKEPDEKVTPTKSVKSTVETVLKETNVFSDSLDRPFLVQLVAKEEKHDDFKIKLTDNPDRKVSSSGSHTESEDTRKDVGELKTSKGKSSETKVPQANEPFAGKTDDEAKNLGSVKIFTKPVDPKKSTKVVTSDRPSRDQQMEFNLTPEVLYKPVGKTNEERRTDLNFSETHTSALTKEEPKMTISTSLKGLSPKVSKIGSESVKTTVTGTTSVPLNTIVTDRLESVGTVISKRPQPVMTSTGGRTDVRLHKYGGTRPYSRTPIPTTSRPSTTTSGRTSTVTLTGARDENEEVQVIEARRRQKMTVPFRGTLSGHVIEEEITIDGFEPRDFLDQDGDSALKVAKEGSDKSEVVKAAVGQDNEEISRLGCLSWTFASSFVTSFLASVLCYVVIRSRRTSTYRIRESLV